MTQMMPDALESRTISIPGDGRRLDVALSEAAGLTRSRVAALMADGNVTVDGKVETKSGAKAKQGQIVILTIPRAEARRARRAGNPAHNSLSG